MKHAHVDRGDACGAPSLSRELVSVIVPTFNRCDTLAESLDSVYRQTYRPIELLVVDDGSTDPTESVVTEWAARRHSADFQVRYIRQDNAGAPAARNRGLALCAGAFVQFLDSDDVLLEHKLSQAMGVYAQDSGLDMVYSSWLVEGNGVTRHMLGPDLEEDCSVSAVVMHYLTTFAPLYRRELLEHIGGWNVDLVCSQDRDLCTRAVSVIRRAKRFTDPGCIYRLHLSSTSISSTRGLRRVMSEWKTNMMMTQYVLEDASPKRTAALQKLARRKIRNAESALAYGDPAFARQIMLSDHRIWRLGLREVVKGVLLVGRTLLPALSGPADAHVDSAVSSGAPVERPGSGADRRRL